MISFDEAMALVAERVAPLAAEPVPLGEANGRWLAADIAARIASPRHTVSAMDGYAVAERAVFAGAPMPILGEARPGRPFTEPLPDGTALRIFTGAALPPGADFVVMQEYASRDGDVVRFAEGFSPARHVRLQGSDFAIGDIVLERGNRIGPASLVAAAAADVAQIAVYARPNVVLLATGDELAEPGDAARQEFAIPDSISPALAARVEAAGGVVVDRQRARDDLPALQQLAGALLETADLVVVTGGASVGERDFARPMFAPYGLELFFASVAIKPGKPIWLGRAGEALVLGLPGNPTSAMVTARLFLEPLLAAMQGGRPDHRWRRLPLAAALPATGDRETFARASWEEEGLRPLGNQDSGVQGGLALADWLIRCPPGQAELPCGTLVAALAF